MENIAKVLFCICVLVYLYISISVFVLWTPGIIIFDIVEPPALQIYTQVEYTSNKKFGPIHPTQFSRWIGQYETLQNFDHMLWHNNFDSQFHGQ